jgi:hypothetical protein
VDIWKRDLRGTGKAAEGRIFANRSVLVAMIMREDELSPKGGIYLLNVLLLLFSG